MNFKNAFALLWIGILVAGCAHSYQFQNTAPIHAAEDNRPSPVPSKTSFNFVEYSVTSSVRYPLVDMLDPRRIPRSQDVNSHDQVPGSSWYTPRLGANEISPEMLVKGPEQKGPPQMPVTIIKTKTQGNSPGFLIQDARGLKYLIKFDRSDYPALESTANFVVNRLFWGFGYHVPEDFIFYFPAEVKNIAVAEGVDPLEVEKAFAFSSTEEDGRYRAVASLFLEGKILGLIGQKGTRRGDINDTIPHENRRTLRALRMFCAWLNNSGVRSDNSLDVYVGEPNQGHTVHYFLDFGETFGVHGIEKGRTWDGFEHFFSWSDMSRDFFTFGFPVKKWESLKIPPYEFLGSFESELFEPENWKETTPFLPIRSSLPDDDYWAAKIIAAVQPEHLRALFNATNHPDKDYIESVARILAKRRQKILTYAFSRVSPLEFSSLEKGRLVLEDLGRNLWPEQDTRYHVRFLDNGSNKIAPDAFLSSDSTQIEIALSEAMASKNYFMVEVRVIRDNQKAPRVAQFHFYGSGETPKLAGVVH